MKEIVVISGKGGTGKTSLVALWPPCPKHRYWRTAMWTRPTCTRFWNPGADTQKTFPAASLPDYSDKCSNCGKCFELCRFEAIIKDDSKQPVFCGSHRL